MSTLIYIQISDVITPKITRDKNILGTPTPVNIPKYSYSLIHVNLHSQKTPSTHFPRNGTFLEPLVLTQHTSIYDWVQTPSTRSQLSILSQEDANCKFGIDRNISMYTLIAPKKILSQYQTHCDWFYGFGERKWSGKQRALFKGNRDTSALHYQWPNPQ